MSKPDKPGELPRRNGRGNKPSLEGSEILKEFFTGSDEPEKEEAVETEASVVEKSGRKISGRERSQCL